MNVLISIITPAYNSSKLISQTYQAILSQTYCNWEWIVTDDCSTDDTFEVLKKISFEDERVKVFRNNKNSGAAISRNNSIENAKGEYLAFIDSDDLWIDNKLELQLKFMIDKRINFSFTAYEIIDHNDNSTGKFVDTHHKKSLSYSDMLRKKATLGCSTVMLRKNAFSDLKMPLIRTGQDYALWLKLLKDGNRAYPLTTVLTKYRILPNSISRNKFKKAKRQWQIYRQLEDLSFFSSLECFCFYGWRAVFRK
ncbi:glycosyltransferase [Vibrio parahaemolyticus]|uniref:glycosyltransferase family 2 protein n=1 Tax=Vibrio parahaemolyticus TaxID=670 RepID=UPI0028797CAC|nr:glycosyltransferase family 2 protein [Vibrio parahaemolyticus]MDS1909561.1 glycosyltransferase family 2 protein [Vibrio parahaemolyticus]WMO09194.1 glycosyltransferase [Vibrio parahaemolyticus]